MKTSIIMAFVLPLVLPLNLALAEPEKPRQLCAEALSSLKYGFLPTNLMGQVLLGQSTEQAHHQLTRYLASRLLSKKRLPTAQEVRDFLKRSQNSQVSVARAEIENEWPFLAFLKETWVETLDPVDTTDETVIARLNQLPNEEQSQLRASYQAAVGERAKELIDQGTLKLDIELQRWAASDAALFGRSGLYVSAKDFIAELRLVHPMAYQGLARLIWQQAFLFFRHRLIPPTFDVLRDILRFEDPLLLQAMLDQPDFWEEGLRTDVGRHIFFARKRIVTAYARAIRGTDTAVVHRTRRIRPTLRRLVEVLLLTKSNENYQWRALNGDYGKIRLYKDGKLDRDSMEQMLEQFQNELEAMLGLRTLQNSSWVFPMPDLFQDKKSGQSGLDVLYTTARGEYQPTFASYEDIVQFPAQYADRVLNKITEAKGILVSSVHPGWQIDWDLLSVMLTQAKEMGFEVVIIPANGSVQDLDRDLVEMPGVNILTTTIENREFLLTNFPSRFRKEPFKPFLSSSSMFKVGQQILLPSHLMGAAVVPTDENEENQTQLFASGTINRPIVPTGGRSNLEKAYVLSRTLKRGYTVAEKIDRGTDPESAPTNHWHIRPIEWKPTDNLKLAGGLAVDKGRVFEAKYTINGQRRVTKRDSQWVSIVLPDIHFLVANPQVMTALKLFVAQFYRDGFQVELVAPDPIDSKALNHWIELKAQNDRELNRMAKNGQLDFNREVNDAIANVNVILAEFPKAVVTFQYSNHSDEWIDRNLMNAPRWLQLVHNGPLIDELRYACRRGNWKPLEYLLVHRREFEQAAAAVTGSDRYKDEMVFVSDPERVRVARQGEKLWFGTDPAWGAKAHHHGHQGSNGAKGSARTHRVSNARAFTGDSHRFEYMASGENFWGSVGASAFSQSYTAGGYSSWSVALGVVWDTGTMGMYNWDPYTGSFMQRPELGVLGREFFGNDPLKITGPMDDDIRRQGIDTKEFMTWFESLKNMAKPGLLSAPPGFGGKLVKVDDYED